MSGDPSASAVEHAFAELKKIYHDAPNRPPRNPSTNRMRGIDYYGMFDLVSAVARGAELFKQQHRYWPSMDQPRSFSEHIFRYKYLGEFPVPSVGDKLAARAWVEQRASADLLTNVHWIGTDLREAAALDLPAGRYVLKANHGSGLNLRLRLPGAFAEGFEARVKTTQGWLHWEWGHAWGEWQYCGFRRRLFIETFIEFAGHDTPPDFKFYCFDGKVRLIHVDIARFNAHRRAFYTLDWQYLHVRLTHPSQEMPRPACLAEMIAVAETLSAGLRFVRVDLYSDGVDTIRFGELTLTPGNAIEPFSDPDFDQALGRCFNPDTAAGDPVQTWLKRQNR